MIATWCRSCNTINRAIIDRCKYCGSRRVEVKYFDEKLINIKFGANSREILDDNKG